MDQPLLSIVICTYNRDKYLSDCLDHLSKQIAPKITFEILVINNNSTDSTSRICLNYGEKHPGIQFRHLIEERQGLSFSRNRGLTESKSGLISYIDDDAFADPCYVSNLIDYFQQHPEVDAIGGKVIPIYQSREPLWMSRYLLPLVAALDLGNSPRPFKDREFPIGANMAFRRAVLDSSEPFDTQLGRKGSFLGSGEEKDLFFRLRKQKCKIHYVPEVLVSHFIPDERLEAGYIKKMAQGIGKSEARRIRQGPVYIPVSKWFEEFLKIWATVILAVLYVLRGEQPKAVMLIKFRVWLFSSFIKG